MSRTRPRTGPRPRITLRTRLTLAYGTLFAAVALALIALLYVFMKYVPVYSENLTGQGEPYTGSLGSAGPRWAPPLEGVAIREGCGRDPSLTDQLREFGHKVLSPDEGSSHLLVCRPASGAGHTGASGWAASFEVSTKDDFLHALLLFSAVALAVLLVLALLLGWVVAGRMLAPLQQVTATARGIAGSTLHERITLPGPKDEIRELSETFNDMLRRLDRSFEAQSRFASNASHELKTPLTGMRAILQVAMAAPESYRLQDIGPKLLTLTTRSADILHALLTLARADQGGVATEDVPLDEVARETVADTRAESDELGVKLTVDWSQVDIKGDRVLLRQLTGNLVANAIRHNHRGGTAQVRVEEDAENGVARFVVRNTGRHFTQEEVDLMREPFHRLDTRQSARAGAGSAAGHGLGLAVAESITRAHSGTLYIVPLPDGGLETGVALPLAVKPEPKPGLDRRTAP